MLNKRTLIDVNLSRTVSVPAAGASVTSTVLDLATTTPGRIPCVELAITSSAAFAALADGHHITVQLQDSADGVTFANVADLPAYVTTGTGGAGAAAFTVQDQACGITRMVLPCVDASKIADEADAAAVISALEGVADDMDRTGVEIHLETSLGPEEFRRLLDRIRHPMVRVNYDSGNSSSLGFDPRSEFRAYGDRVGSVHIKDRVRGGGTVPLGTGDADFPALFEALKSVDYRGPWVLQVARGTPGEEVDWAKQNLAFLEGYLKGWGQADGP